MPGLRTSFYVNRKEKGERLNQNKVAYLRRCVKMRNWARSEDVIRELVLEVSENYVALLPGEEESKKNLLNWYVIYTIFLHPGIPTHSSSPYSLLMSFHYNVFS